MDAEEAKVETPTLFDNLVIYDKPKELGEFGINRPPQSWCYVEELI